MNTWNGDQYLKELEEKLARNVERAAIHLVNEIKENLNISGDPFKASSGASGVHYKNENPSQPGEMPHKMLGDLQRSITYEIEADKLSAKVGTNIDYGAWLELGTSKMAARPYLRPTLAQEQDTIKNIITTGKP
jgi:HK97 gp10 family phage protein